MAVVKVKRRKPVFRDLLARYYVKIDDDRVGTAKRGEYREFTTAPGEHRIIIEGSSPSARSNSVTIEAKPGQIYLFECGTNGSIFTAAPDAISGLRGERPWIYLVDRTPPKWM